VSRISELAINRRFRLPLAGRTGVVVSHGDSGTRVRYEGSGRRVTGKSKQTDQTFEFDTPGRVVIVSSGTIVEPL
jgi:hypothetical protein